MGKDGRGAMCEYRPDFQIFEFRNVQDSTSPTSHERLQKERGHFVSSHASTPVCKRCSGDRLDCSYDCTTRPSTTTDYEIVSRQTTTKTTTTTTLTWFFRMRILITGTAHLPPPPPHYHHHHRRQRQPQRRGVVASWGWGCLLSIALVYGIVHEQMDINGRLSWGMEDYYHHPDDLEPKANRTMMMIVGSHDDGTEAFPLSTGLDDENPKRHFKPSSLSSSTKESLHASSLPWGVVPPAVALNSSTSRFHNNKSHTTKYTTLPPPPTNTTIIRLRENETFMWMGRQKRLCQRLTREEKEQQKSLKQQYSDHRGKDS